MDQSMIMIPMYNRDNGAHCAIARVRILQGWAHVDMRRSELSLDEALFLLTDKGVHAVRDGRAQLNGETLCGIACVDGNGACKCCGTVRGHEAGFERMLVRLRMDRQSDKRASKPITRSEPVAKPVIKIAAMPREFGNDAVLCSRAMDGYTEANAEVRPEAAEVFAANEPIMDYASETEFLAAHPNVSGEEPGFAVWNAQCEGAFEDEAKAVMSEFAPAKHEEEWSMDAPSAQIPQHQVEQGAQVMSAGELFPVEDSESQEDIDHARPYPSVMPYRVDNPFPKQFPGSSWVKIQRLQGQGHYLEGHMRRGAEMITITAAPGEYSPVPPRHLQGFTRYIKTKEGGFWVRIRRE